jgi:hypothetical protein
MSAWCREGLEPPQPLGSADFKTPSRFCQTQQTRIFTGFSAIQSFDLRGSVMVCCGRIVTNQSRCALSRGPSGTRHTKSKLGIFSAENCVCYLGDPYSPRLAQGSRSPATCGHASPRELLGDFLVRRLGIPAGVGSYQVG